MAQECGMQEGEDITRIRIYYRVLPIAEMQATDPFVTGDSSYQPPILTVERRSEQEIKEMESLR